MKSQKYLETSMKPAYRIAADIGGTFTDIVMVTEEGKIATRKLLSTPADYAQGVIRGIVELMEELKLSVNYLTEILHGCTVATNAILENKGAKTALLTTKGFRDVLELRRIRMPRLYDLSYIKPEPLVPRHLRFEIDERLNPYGEVLKPLNIGDVRNAIKKIKDTNLEAVAVAFLHSYANPKHELIVGQMLREELPSHFISLSVEVLPEIREYERTSTTVINVYVGPPVRRYLASLIKQLREAGVTGRLLVMQSGGGILEAETAMQRPVEIVECGPAAGVIGAARMGKLTGYSNIITLDMGGTTAKASIIEEGELTKTDEYEVGGGISLSSRLVKGGGYAIKVPVIDISEVGAGGGSIVWFDKAGVLKVGPKSSGADPGPVCYNLGGKAATTTDANVVLGYLNPKSLAGGAVPINAEMARAVIQGEVANPLGQGLYEAAFGIHTVSNANMMRAIKAVSTYRGRDPRDFVMFAFGGSGGVHAVELARELHIKRVVVPQVAGVFSALGLLVANIELGLSKAYLRKTSDILPEEINSAYRALEKEVLSRLDHVPKRVSFSRFADFRYSGQAYELSISVPVEDLTELTIRKLEGIFDSEHEKTYGHRFPDQPKEAVTLRVVGSVASDDQGVMNMRRGVAVSSVDEAKETSRKAYFGPAFGQIETTVFTSRASLSREPLQGPLIIEEYEGTVVITPDAQASLDDWGNVIIDIAS
jgi:N-methylhydantoinase A